MYKGEFGGESGFWQLSSTGSQFGMGRGGGAVSGLVFCSLFAFSTNERVSLPKCLL